MGQNEIFKLLLIILLLISNHDDCDNNNNSCHGLTGNLNQIIIIMLLLGFIPTNDTSATTDNDTTF